MKNFHPLSFGLGLASGLLILMLVFGGMRVFGRPAGGGTFAGGNGGPRNITRMAQRLGMTEADLQKEIDGGKTMQEIAQEHGVTFTGRRQRSGSGAAAPTGSG